MSNCTYVLAGLNKAYPRTCADCGLGLCKLGINSGTFEERVEEARIRVEEPRLIDSKDNPHRERFDFYDICYYFDSRDGRVACGKRNNWTTRVIEIGYSYICFEFPNGQKDNHEVAKLQAALDAAFTAGKTEKVLEIKRVLNVG